MMGQELFEHPRRQYEKYAITAFAQFTDIIGDPANFDEGQPNEVQEAALAEIFAAHPGKAVTFDESAGVWIAGDEGDIERMFADRDEFVDALERGEDPGP